MNRTLISGNLCQDAQTTATKSDTGLVSFNIANNDKSIKRQDGSYESVPCFILIKIWTKSPDKFLFKKGDMVIVDGMLSFEQWEKDGQKHSRNVIETSHFIASGWPVMKIDKNREDDCPF